MKVLLLSDFSGFHRYLKEGLEALGVEVYLRSGGDGWKKTGGDNWGLKPMSPYRIVRMKRDLIDPFFEAPRFRGFDVVQFMHPDVFKPVISFMNNYMFNQIKKHNKCVTLVAAGGGTALRQAYEKGLFDYYAFDLTGLKSDKTLQARAYKIIDRHVEKNVDLIIPSLYEYTLEHIGKVYPAIPSPLNTDSIKYSENRVKGKIVFMHGINRELAKGTPYIRESLQRLAQKYPNDVEVIMEGHLPLNEYIQFMNRANVLVDQCMGYGYGINATIGMAQGKIVMAGARPETLHAMHVDTCPIIHIQPDVDQIFSQMEWIVQNRSHITEMGEKSRLFVEEYHDCKKVAQQYIDAWKSTGKI